MESLQDNIDRGTLGTSYFSVFFPHLAKWTTSIRTFGNTAPVI